jgi:hypothetical protein
VKLGTLPYYWAFCRFDGKAWSCSAACRGSQSWHCDLFRLNDPQPRLSSNNHPIDSQALTALWSHWRQIRTENPNKAKAVEARGLPPSSNFPGEAGARIPDGATPYGQP